MIPLGDDVRRARPAVVTIGLVAVCVLVWFWELSLGDAQLESATLGLGLIPTRLVDGVPLAPDVTPRVGALTSILTSMFLHGGWMHLIGNMAFLWIFGRSVEDSMGPGRFAAFYVLGGVFAGLVHAFTDPHSALPMVGASGAISGVLGAYLLLFPTARITVLVPIVIILTTVRLPAVLALGFWFALQLVSYKTGGEGVAWMAHIGGFVAGMVLVLFFRRPDVPLLGRAVAPVVRNASFRGF